MTGKIYHPLNFVPHIILHSKYELTSMYLTKCASICTTCIVQKETIRTFVILQSSQSKFIYMYVYVEAPPHVCMKNKA